MPTFTTAGEILNDAAVELGLAAADMADPYASADPAIVQLRRLLKALGRDLLRDYRWTHLTKTYQFITTPGVEAYPLPPDFSRLLDGTEWNRSQQMPLGGPINAQGWQWLKAMTSTGTVWLNFRIVGNQLLLNPLPAAIDGLAFEYVSTWWVQDFPSPSGPLSPTPNVETPDNAAEVLWFDARLLVAGLRLRFLSAKGFATGAAQREFDDALAAAQGGDGAAPVLSMDGCGGQLNPDRPISGFGGPVGGSGSSTPPVGDGLDVILEAEVIF